MRTFPQDEDEEARRLSGAPLVKRSAGVVLVGFMGAGKSTVGKLLAERLHLPFRDVDQEVVRRSGMSVAQIFSTRGEAQFRRLEREAIGRFAGDEPAVVSTGGGALQDAANREALARLGVWAWLKASPATVWERLSGNDARPLLQGGSAEVRERIERLMREREPLYAKSEIHVETDGQSPSQVADAVCGSLRGLASSGSPGGSIKHRPVTVRLGERSYPVYVGADCLPALGERLAGADVGRQGLLVTNPHVGSLFAGGVQESLHAAGFRVEVAIMPDGERRKNLKSVERLYDSAIAAGLDRRGFVVALGGGVIGDTAGFLAATFMRGIPFVQVPTTLLAQVDAGVGGKVGVNHPKGKNLIGAFHQPRLVMADVSTLASLPEREWRSGMAEVIKEGLMADPALFEYVEARGADSAEWGLQERAHAVRRSVEIKAAVVEADEREGGERALLNLGHTVGHAVESLTQYDHERITHGEAVALGLLTACLVSERLTGFPRAETRRIGALLEASGYPIRLEEFSISQVLAALRHDKKVIDGRITMALLSHIGKAVLVRDVPPGTIEDALSEQMEWARARRGG